MREAAFVKQNKDKWIQFEKVLRNNISMNPDELSALYLEITDHLSYAQTFYPESQTHQYLNKLAALAHQRLYKNKRKSANQLLRFYTKDFPAFFSNYQKQLLFSFLVFLVFSIIGAYSAATDSQFVRLIMGDAYVNMTLANIEKGDPMAVYKKMEAMDMFLGITINNIIVSLMAFVYGIFLSFGSVYILAKNAVMLGSFQYFFYEHQLLWESVRTIWIHGTLEIAAVIVAGAAGIVLGNSLLFPKTYSRLQSFQRGAKDGLKILASTFPVFIIAGFLEGFVTRHTQMPDWTAIVIIGSSLIFVLCYYVFYPLYLKSKNNLNPIYE